MRTRRRPLLRLAAGGALVASAIWALLQRSDMPNPIVQLAESALAVFGIRTAEQPPYQVLDRVGDVEIRPYGPRFAAETSVDAKANNAMNEAFFILAGYIFGGNRQKRDIAMTAPVASGRGKAIAMTAPAALAGDDSSALTMRFFLPAAIRSDNAPEPNDPRVRLIEVPEETVAALRFTGTWGAAAIEARGRKLLLRLRDSRWSPIGKPFTQLYDPPFTIPWLRRNEVAVLVASRS